MVDPDSKQRVQGLAVSLRVRDDMQVMFRPNFAYIIDQQGNFEIRGVLPGAYFVEAVKQGAGKTLRAQQPIDIRESRVEGPVTC